MGGGVLLLAVHVHLHLFQHVRGPAIDYLAVALAAFASWAGFPGPGEPVLIAAAVFASKHDLDITPLVFWAWVGATAGGVLGWVIGLKAGRRVLAAPGPLHGMRVRAIERGERVFRRFEILAIILMPSWVAGVNGSRARVYLLTNAVSASLLWAVPISLGAYYAGPPLLDAVNDLGTIAGAALITFVVILAGGEIARRRRGRRAPRPSESGGGA